ncbi:MAG: toll/interleukin-1 receptor domain-containing protein [Pseudomonadota bacterium]
MSTTPGYDVFISYAREDGPWVREHLFEPLSWCRTKDGGRPRIFFDVSKEGIQPGQDFIEALSRAILDSRFVILVYSRTYFSKPMCHWEAKKAWQLDPSGDLQKLAPVLLDPSAEAEIPFTYNHIQFTRLTEEDWFSRLVRNLDLLPRTENRPVRLTFRSRPADALVGTPLSPVQVAVEDESGASMGDLPVTLAVEGAEITGSLTVPTLDGLATFADLCFLAPAETARLIASAPGLQPCASEPFSIVAPRETLGSKPSGDSAAPRPVIPCDGEAFFLGRGHTVVTVEPHRLAAWDVGGRLLGEAQLPAPVRVTAHGDDLVALADWAGNVHLVHASGACTTVSPPAPGDGGFHVPGALAVAGERVFVGYWSGDLVQIVPGQAPTRLLRHEAGIQGLALQYPHLYVLGLDDVFVHHGQQGPPLLLPVGERARWLVAFSTSAVVVGTTRLFHYSARRRTLLADDLGLGRIADAHVATAVPAVLDEDGLGLRFDAELGVRARYGVTPGSTLIAADDAGLVTAVRHPDGSCSLLFGERVACTARTGTLTVARDGALVLASCEGGVCALPLAEVEGLRGGVR